MQFFKNIISNGFILMVPALIWNIVLTSKLPNAYQPENFNANIPTLINIGEATFRLIIFIFPAFVKTNVSSRQGKLGLIIYMSGTLIYFLAWILLINNPNMFFNKNVFGFTAPAYTPLIWLIGLSLMFKSYYFKILYKKWHYIIPVIVFTIFHVSHTLIVFYTTKTHL